MLCRALHVRAAAVHGWKRNSWNSFFRRHLLNLIIWKDMKSAFQRHHTHIKPLSVPSCQGDPAVCDMAARTIYFCGGVKALHEHSHIHTQICTQTKNSSRLCRLREDLQEEEKNSKTWWWKNCMDSWRGPLTSFLLRKHGIKDRMTVLHWMTRGPPTLTGSLMRRDHSWQVFCLIQSGTMWPL